MFLDFYFIIDEYLFEIFIIDVWNKDLNFPHFRNEVLLNAVIIYFLYLFINS